MKFIILGQPRSGKTTLAKILSKELGIPVICTDKYRYNWGFHEPWKGYSTEVSPLNQKEFYHKLLELYNSYDNVILEGSAIDPADINLFPNDGVVLLYRTLSADERLKESRKYDTDWTTKRDDKYLLDLFDIYKAFSDEWVKNNKEISINTDDYFNGINNAKNKLLLVQHNLIYPEPEGEYTSFFKTGFNMDLLQYVKEELQYNNKGENDE